MWFNAVPEPKTAKNPMHPDLQAPAEIQDEVRRLAALGANLLLEDDDLVTMCDAEGNEFCVE
jgi:hypothetical protein